MELIKNKAIISFDVADPLLIKNAALATVYIAGADQQFYPAQVQVKNDKLIAWSKQVAKPIAVRYAFSNTATANIFTKTGMPVAPFRTDNWVVDTASENSK